MQKLWRLHPHDAPAVAALAKAAGVSGTVAQLLMNRGVTDPGEAKRFLDGPLSDLHSPNDLPNVPAVAELIHTAVKAGQKICVYGDYDADGVSRGVWNRRRSRRISGRRGGSWERSAGG